MSCNIGKRAVAVVMVQKIAVDTGNVEVRPAVVVVVRRCDAHAVAFTAKSSFFCDVGKRSVVVVVIQAIVEARTVFGESRDCRTIGEENVEVAVVIVVQKRDATKDTVDNGLVLRGVIIEDELNTG